LLQIPLTRKDIAFNIDYEINDDLNLFIESAYTQTESSSNLEPTITGQFITIGDVDLTIPSDNPFIPLEVLDTWTDVGDPIRKRFSELGSRHSEQNRDTVRLAMGLERDFSGW
jgi:hypothetical protein